MEHPGGHVVTHIQIFHPLTYHKERCLEGIIQGV